jgi:hypothetical protein
LIYSIIFSQAFNAAPGNYLRNHKGIASLLRSS